MLRYNEALPDPVALFYDSLSVDSVELLDVYGFNNVGRTPEAMLQVVDEADHSALLEKCRQFKQAPTEDRKKIAKEIATLVDDSLSR